MQFPYFNPQLALDAVVNVFDCPVCEFRALKTTKANLLNNGTLYCSHCGKITVSDHLRSNRIFNPTSLIRQLVHCVGPVLDYLGTGQADDSWEFINLWSSKSVLVSRKLDGAYVRLDFRVTYESDCQIALALKPTSPNLAGFPLEPKVYASSHHRKLPPQLEALMLELERQGYGRWGCDQRWADMNLIKGDMHWINNQHLTVRGVQLHLSWR